MSNGLPPIVCSICTELFLFVNQHEPTQLIGCTPCGHTFHLHCLNQWLSNANSCPQCRTATRKKNAIRLYFDQPAIIDNDVASQVTNLTDGTISRLNARVSELNDQLQSKTSALEKARNEAGRLAEQLASSKDVYTKTKSHLDEERSKNKILRQRFDELTSKSEKIDELMKRNESLTRKMAILDTLQKAAVEECEAEIDKLLHPQSGHSDTREILTWLAVTSRELRSQQNRVKASLEENKKLRDRLATEKVRCSTLSEDLRKRNDDLTRCEAELKSVEEKLKKQQAELAKYRVAASGNAVNTESPALQPKPVQSASSACRDIFESPAFERKPITAISKGPANENTNIVIDLDDVETVPKKSRAAFSAFKEASPVTPLSVTEFRKMATKALRSTTEAPTAPFSSLQSSTTNSTSSTSSAIQPPPMRRGYNGLGGHSMSFGFPVSNHAQSSNSNSQQTKPKSFFTLPSQPATKRKL